MLYCGSSAWGLSDLEQASHAKPKRKQRPSKTVTYLSLSLSLAFCLSVFLSFNLWLSLFRSPLLSLAFCLSLFLSFFLWLSLFRSPPPSLSRLLSISLSLFQKITAILILSDTPKILRYQTHLHSAGKTTRNTTDTHINSFHIHKIINPD